MEAQVIQGVFYVVSIDMPSLSYQPFVDGVDTLFTHTGFTFPKTETVIYENGGTTYTYNLPGHVYRVSAARHAVLVAPPRRLVTRSLAHADLHTKPGACWGKPHRVPR
jgi:hypothetical protein